MGVRTREEEAAPGRDAGHLEGAGPPAPDPAPVPEPTRSLGLRSTFSSTYGRRSIPKRTRARSGSSPLRCSIVHRPSPPDHIRIGGLACTNTSSGMAGASGDRAIRLLDAGMTGIRSTGGRGAGQVGAHHTTMSAGIVRREVTTPRTVPPSRTSSCADSPSSIVTPRSPSLVSSAAASAGRPPSKRHRPNERST